MNNRVVIWSVTGVVAMLLAIMSLFAVGFALARLQTEQHASCERANSTRAAVVKLVKDQLKITPRTPPSQAAAAQAFIDATSRDLAPVACP